MGWYLMQYFANRIFSFVLYKLNISGSNVKWFAEGQVKWMRTLEWSFSGAFSCYANQTPVVHNGVCYGMWRCLADLCLPECCRSITFPVCHLERKRGGRKTIHWQVVLNIEFSFRRSPNDFFSVYPEIIRYEGQNHDYQVHGRLIFNDCQYNT